MEDQTEALAMNDLLAKARETLKNANVHGTVRTGMSAASGMAVLLEVAESDRGLAVTVVDAFKEAGLQLITDSRTGNGSAINGLAAGGALRVEEAD